MLQYSINKSKVRLGFVGQEWEQHIVAELDSALNKWIDAVPDHRVFFVSRPPHHLTHRLLQYAGILTEKIYRSSTNRPSFMPCIITCKFWCIDPSFLRLVDLRHYRFHR